MCGDWKDATVLAGKAKTLSSWQWEGWKRLWSVYETKMFFCRIPLDCWYTVWSQFRNFDASSVAKCLLLERSSAANRCSASAEHEWASHLDWFLFSLVKLIKVNQGILLRETFDISSSSARNFESSSYGMHWLWKLLFQQLELSITFCKLLVKLWLCHAKSSDSIERVPTHLIITVSVLITFNKVTLH